MEKEKINRVLIVDDDTGVLAALNRGLRKQPYEKIFVESGEEALLVLAKKEISVLVTDMRMPKMTGLELLKIVKERYPDVVRIVLSGYTQIAQLIATINNGDIYKFIAKPWQLEEEFIPLLEEAMDYYNNRRKKQKLFEAYKEAYIQQRGEGLEGERRIQKIRDVSQDFGVCGMKDEVLMGFSKIAIDALIEQFYSSMQKGMLSFRQERVEFVKTLMGDLIKRILEFSVQEEREFQVETVGILEEQKISFMDDKTYGYSLYGNLVTLQFLYQQILNTAQQFSKNGTMVYGLKVEEAKEISQIHLIVRFPNNDTLQRPFIEAIFSMIDQVAKIFGGYISLHFLQDLVYVDFNMPLFQVKES